MTHPIARAAFLFGLAVTASAVEWDASRYSIGAYAGFAGPVNEQATPGVRLSLAGSASIPLIVEQHLVMTPMISLHYQPMIAPEESGLVGGNFLSGSAAFLIEHDFFVGGMKGWFGGGPQVSVNATAGQYQWQSQSGELDAVAIDNEFGLSAEAYARLGLEIRSQYSVWLAGQYTPMSSGYNGVSIGAAYTF
ncbi:hypothetical protein [Reinekea blandensis]|uniref:Outer membrane protein beta-barrel domain-containing protein n=1 Tax=Reinekea blandensis MED297 TaxID=314283 RepID=A4BEW6_9GAMM|nr:hypothetical protein [Reinekea blandensis]EAR09301.1 hypothetical protein MED297_18473 [Reinekea sp. MED297] [Reinekea blandensis MED297]